MNINLCAKDLTRFLLGIFVLLFIAHVTLQVTRFWIDDHFLFGLLAAFSLGGENNFPAYFSTILLLLCSSMLALIFYAEYVAGNSKITYWLVLSFIFLYLSMDEMMQIHERLTEPTTALIGEEYSLHYSWVIPYALLLVIFVAFYSRFLFRIPRRTAMLFVTSGIIYVGGAIGFETMSGGVSAQSGNSNPLYVMLQTMEEVLEMLGAILFIYALADYCETKFGHVGVKLSRETAGP